MKLLNIVDKLIFHLHAAIAIYCQFPQMYHSSSLAQFLLQLLVKDLHEVAVKPDFRG